MEKIQLDNKIVDKLKSIIGNEKNYSNFSRNKEKAYKYCSELGLAVCPYCNINYIYTVTNGNKYILRPDLDHFHAKSVFKKIQLDVFNLIPSCSTCNSRLKGRISFSKGKYIHPFFHDFNSIKMFSINMLSASMLNQDSFELKLGDISKDGSLTKMAENNVMVFKIVERYQHHKDVVVSLLRKAEYYTSYKCKEISNLSGVHGLYEILFLDELTSKINNTSLAKLKKDIVKQYIVK